MDSSDEDQEVPIYGEDSPKEGEGVLAAALTFRRAWWFKVGMPSSSSGHQRYERWTLLQVWMSRAAPVLEESLSDLPPGPLLLSVEFEGNIGDGEANFPESSYEEVLNDLSVDVDLVKRRVSIFAGEEFERGVLHAENISEVALVSTIVTGFAKLAGTALSEEHRWLASTTLSADDN